MGSEPVDKSIGLVSISHFKKISVYMKFERAKSNQSYNFVIFLIFMFVGSFCLSKKNNNNNSHRPKFACPKLYH